MAATATAKKKSTTKFPAKKLPGKAQKALAAAVYKAKNKKPKELIEKHNGFEVRRQLTRNYFTNAIEVLTTIVITDTHFCDWLQKATDDPTFYRNSPQISARAFLSWYGEIDAEAAKPVEGAVISMVAQCADLRTVLDTEFKADIDQLKALLAAGKISYQFLWYIFRKGRKVVCEQNGAQQGMVITGTKYHEDWSVFFSVHGQMVTSNGRSFYVTNTEFKISAFNGVKDIASLTIRPMTDEVQTQLVERGRKYAEIAKKASHMEYVGSAMISTWLGDMPITSDGRVMIDEAGFERMSPDRGGRDEGTNFDVVPEDKLFMTAAWIRGMSFVTRRWCKFSVAKLNPVAYDSEAFQHLVRPEAEKQMMLALAEHGPKAFTDIISGKGGGVVYLLYGPTGTGKTLTAESLAEHLKKPLYKISIGELGVSPDEVEEKLQKILEICQTWDAIPLLDEGDIMMEARSEDNDIVRNAIVCVFLRLLEYHQGVIFITTNRVASFDPALFSRIALATHYKPLSREDLTSIWHMLVKSAKIDLTDAEIIDLVKRSSNGRQIKNCIRAAQAMSMAEKVPTSMKHFTLIMDHMASFDDAITAANAHRILEPVNASQGPTQ